MTDSPATLEELIAPDSSITIGDEKIEVRAFRFLEGLRATAIARPLIDDMRKLFQGEDDIAPNALLDLFGKHAEIWVQLVAISTRREVDWVKALGDIEGTTLLMTFWGINKSFFTTRLILGAAVNEAAELSRTLQSVNSSAPVMEETRETSPSDTPGDRSSTAIAS